MGKWLVIFGVLIALVGVLVILKVHIPFGNLPGDISFQGKNFSFYFPIVSCIILSIILSLIFYFFS